MQKKQIFALA